MDNYYFLSWEQKATTASAFAPEGTKLDHELIPDLDGLTELPFELQLVKLTLKKDGLIRSNDLTNLKSIWLDYQPNSLAWPLMSGRLKAIILEAMTGKECINWITAKVKGLDEYRNYYIPRFEKILDVLDFDHTLFVKNTDHIIRPHFSNAKVHQYSIFHSPNRYDLWKITSGLYVNETLKNKIQKNQLTGITFEKARSS